MSVELLDFAPIPGLQAVAKTLLNIWDALQMVDVSARTTRCIALFDVLLDESPRMSASHRTMRRNIDIHTARSQGSG